MPYGSLSVRKTANAQLLNVNRYFSRTRPNKTNNKKTLKRKKDRHPVSNVYGGRSFLDHGRSLPHGDVGVDGCVRHDHTLSLSDARQELDLFIRSMHHTYIYTRMRTGC